jgi:glycosyltransferase involved in cell wall biosynthesis
MVEFMASQPRVLHVAEAFGGGVLEMVRTVAESASQAGADHAIAYGRRPETPADPRQVIASDVDLFPLDWHRGSPASQVVVARRLRALCQRMQPDVVHLHSSFAGAIGVAALRGVVPLIYTPHAYPSSIDRSGRTVGLCLRAAERHITRSVDYVGAVSETEAELAEQLGARHVVCIPNGIPELDDVSFSDAPPVATLSGRPRVIAIGRLSDQRRPEACARIFSAVRDVAEVAWVGGAGTDAKRGGIALAALTEAGAPPTGWVPRETVLDELGRATVYLHWTEWDGRALSLLEAFARDAVVVASDVAPNREVCSSRQLCETEDDAIRLIRRIATDPAFARQLRDEQRRRAGEHSAATMVDRWRGLYADLARLPLRRPGQTERLTPALSA